MLHSSVWDSQSCEWNIPSPLPNLSSSSGRVGGGMVDPTKSLSLRAHSHFCFLRSFTHAPASELSFHFTPPQSGYFKQTMTAMIRNEVFSCFVFYGVLLVLKMYVIAIITGQVRLRKKVSESESGERRNLILQISLGTSKLWLMPSFLLFPERRLPTPRTRWDMEGCSFTERIHMWRGAGGERAERLSPHALSWKNTLLYFFNFV